MVRRARWSYLVLFRQLQICEISLWILRLTGPYKLAPGQIIYFHLKNKYSKHLERGREREMEREKEDDKDRYYPPSSGRLQSLWFWLKNIVTKHSLRLVCGYRIAARLRCNIIINMRISVSSLCRHIQDIQQQDYIDCIGDCQRLFLSPTKKADQQRLRITLSQSGDV